MSAGDAAVRLFVSWSNREAPYQERARPCRVLVSPNNVPRTWTCATNWAIWPDELLIDSGAFQLRSQQEPAAILERQLAIVAGAPTSCRVALTHADLRIDLRSYEPARWQNLAARSLERAHWLATALAEGELGRCEPLGVIQAYDVRSAWACGRALLSMGFRRFGIGSLVPLVHGGKERLLDLVEATLHSGASPLHVFGVSSPGLLPALRALGVDSVDTATPIKEALNGSIDYAHPFRRFKIPGCRSAAASAHNYAFRLPFRSFFPCACAVCTESPETMLEDSAVGKAARAHHNYYQLRLEVEGANAPDASAAAVALGASIG